MTDAEKVVRGFIAHFEKSWPASLPEALELLSDDCYYQMVVPTIAPVKGKAEVLKALEAMMEKVEDQKHDMINVAVAGDVVFTERMDHSLRNGKWVEVPLVAVFKVNKEGKISEWREYLDIFNNLRQHGLSFEEMQNTIKH